LRKDRRKHLIGQQNYDDARAESGTLPSVAESRWRRCKCFWHRM